MHIAFYAPLKSPRHPAPSGDREMARALFEALEASGHELDLACELRSFDKDGDMPRQRRLAQLGARAARLFLRRIDSERRRAPDLWFTYHLHHKAPDHLGPAVTERLRIPYVVAEASIAMKRATGAWATGFEAARSALRAADMILALTERDRAGLANAGLPKARIRLLPPFLNTAEFPCREAEHEARTGSAIDSGLFPPGCTLVTVAMMRDGIKQQSYRLLAEALATCLDLPRWHLLVAGDGPARSPIERHLTERLPNRVTFLGLVPRAELSSVYRSGQIFVWPALEEAYGLAVLEAQASGLPVVVGREGGVPEVVQDGVTGLVTDARDPAAFGRAVRFLIAHDEQRRAMGRRAAAHVRARHDTRAARAILASAIEQACDNRAQVRAR